MRLLSPEEICKQRMGQRQGQRRQAGRLQAGDLFSSVDPERPFIPEQYTQLYHSGYYTLLSDAQRLRYNQLYGTRTNEQFMYFESGFTRHVMQNLLKMKRFHGQTALCDCLHLLLQEEDAHFQMFQSLNMLSLPELYQQRSYYFLRLSVFERALLSLVCRFPQHLVCLLWLVLLMEEHAVRFSRDMLKNAASETLGPLERNFVLAHKLHLQDEAGHVHIDGNLIDFVLEQSSRSKKALNVKLLARLLRATLKPKHAGVRVLRHLVSEFPELSAHYSQLLKAIRGFDYDPVVTPMLANSDHIPVTTLLLGLYPEFEQSLAL